MAAWAASSDHVKAPRISKGMSGSVQGEHRRAVARELADLTPLQRERLREIMRERYEQSGPVEREHYRQGPYGRH